MDLRKLMDVVIDSAQEDWHLIADAPSYHDHLKFYEARGTGSNVLHVEAHHSTAVHIPDVSITMAWGLKWQEDFQGEWCKNFPDPHANGGWLDIFFHSALVYRSSYVWVDGIYLPLPKHKDGRLEVPKRACDLMSIIDQMGQSPRPDFNPYESDLKRAGFTVVDEEWPKFPRKPSVYEKRGILSI
jgi:hypothetical protein